MDLAATLIALGAVVAGGVFAGWRGARPWNPAVGGVRMAPWRLIMVLCGAAAFVLVIHLAALLGAPTAAMVPTV
jgi:hypothetical protein